MKAVRFTAEGLINSFRIPQTSAHQLTYLVPTKTQIAGLLASIMGKGEADYYDLLRRIKVGIIPLNWIHYLLMHGHSGNGKKQALEGIF